MPCTRQKCLGMPIKSPCSPGLPEKLPRPLYRAANKLVAKAVLIRKIPYPLGLLLSRVTYEAVAQLVEQQTFNLWVLGSIPSGLIVLGVAGNCLFCGFLPCIAVVWSSVAFADNRASACEQMPNCAG